MPELDTCAPGFRPDHQKAIDDLADCRAQLAEAQQAAVTSTLAHGETAKQLDAAEAYAAAQSELLRRAIGPEPNHICGTPDAACDSLCVDWASLPSRPAAVAEILARLAAQDVLRECLAESDKENEWHVQQMNRVIKGKMELREEFWLWRHWARAVNTRREQAEAEVVALREALGEIAALIETLSVQEEQDVEQGVNAHLWLSQAKAILARALLSESRKGAQ